MASIERTAYPRFKRLLSASELAEVYTPSAKEIEFAVSRARGQDSILSLLVLLKSFQRLGYFPNKLKEVPAQIVTHVRACLALGGENHNQAEQPAFQTRSFYRYHQAIRRFLGVKPYKEAAQEVAAEAVREAAQVMNNPADLINVAIEKLVKDCFELPAYRTLDSLVQRIRTQVNTALCEQVWARLNQAEQTKLAALVTKASELEESKPLSDWARLK